MTPLERAAKAMMKLDVIKRESYPNLARATLAAIEEPSEDMIRRGIKVLNEPVLRSDADTVTEVWRAMIKAALEEAC